MSSATMYVNKAGIADAAPPYVRDAITKLQQRASGTRAAASAVSPAPAAPVVNDTTTGLKAGAKRAAGLIGRKLVAPAAVAGAVASGRTPDSTARYAQRFGVQEPTGDGSVGDVAKFAALRAGGFASDLGDNLSGGLIGKLMYRDKPAAQPAAAPPAPAAQPAAPAAPPATPNAQAKPGEAPPPPPVEAPTPQPGIINRVAPPTPRGPVEFTDGTSPPLPSGEMSAQNQGALNNLMANGAAEARAAAVIANEGQGINATDLAADAASLKNAGFNRKERFEIMQGSGVLNTGENQGIIARSQKQQLAQGDQALQAGALKNQAAGIELNQAAQIGGAVDSLLSLNDENDPGGVQRTQIAHQLRVLGVNKSDMAETPRERYMREVTKAAFTDAMRPASESAQIVADQMAAYDEGRSGLPGAGNVTLDPTQQAADPAAPAAPEAEKPPMPDAKKAPDGNWYVPRDGGWAKVEA